MLAEAICRDLEPDRCRQNAQRHSPGGGETWQLSHGERSRVFARALLQQADVLIFGQAVPRSIPGPQNLSARAAQTAAHCY
jgi:ABC-type transport system involved in cytochrome bd biosynthesis fused ATPase/permease subunit